LSCGGIAPSHPDAWPRLGPGPTPMTGDHSWRCGFARRYSAWRPVHPCAAQIGDAAMAAASRAQEIARSGRMSDRRSAQSHAACVRGFCSIGISSIPRSTRGGPVALAPEAKETNRFSREYGPATARRQAEVHMRQALALDPGQPATRTTTPPLLMRLASTMPTESVLCGTVAYPSRAVCVGHLQPRQRDGMLAVRQDEAVRTGPAAIDD